ncbi:hypothetical protein LTY62_08240 [Limosilactobacillus balticus]|uniref:hypothetical protein n=1 Tax=Limosilactobacillus balticus TaxID=2759747 RepID=UPI001E3B6A79|nr:hypothetical protein [Limosilactobacillus balticus]MCD7137231.1 hypothetical protein [Limosilactobacillus balticus]
MKIDEAVSRIESTSNSICAWKNGNYIHVGFNTFTILVIPDDAKTFFDVHFINPNLELPANLKMQLDGIVGKFLRTPIKERFPEKKYRLRWIDDRNGKANYFYLNMDATWHMVTLKNFADTFTEPELEQLKKDNPRLAPAIDAMKVPAEDIEHDNY